MKVYTVYEVLESTKNKLAEVTAERDALAVRLEDAEDQCSELHNKNSALAAQVAELSKYISIYEELQKLSPPKQHLAEVRAQAGRDEFVAGCLYDNEVHFNDAPFDINIGADQYADSIRQEK